jgi:hypothetical protein
MTQTPIETMWIVRVGGFEPSTEPRSNNDIDPEPR